MDWWAHINSQQDTTIKDELEANRRGGGYLQKGKGVRHHLVSEWQRIGEILQHSRFSQLTQAQLVFRFQRSTINLHRHVEEWIREDIRGLYDRGSPYV